MRTTLSDNTRPSTSRPATLRHPWFQRRHDERGAVLVEAAFMLPILILIVFGVIEISMALQASSKLSDASRAAGRTAAALGGRDNFEEAAGGAAASALSTLPPGADPVAMILYDAANVPIRNYLAGSAIDIPGVTFICSLNTVPCSVFAWNDGTKTFDLTAAWNPVAGTEYGHDTCGPDYGGISVVILVEYEPLTELFSGVLRREMPDPLRDTATFNFDPDLTAVCS